MMNFGNVVNKTSSQFLQLWHMDSAGNPGKGISSSGNLSKKCEDRLSVRRMCGVVTSCVLKCPMNAIK
jgi:hypothetical protein